jgi:hypothetical protein
MPDVSEVYVTPYLHGRGWGDVFFRNVGLSQNEAALQNRILYTSNPWRSVCTTHHLHQKCELCDYSQASMKTVLYLVWMMSVSLQQDIQLNHNFKQTNLSFTNTTHLASTNTSSFMKIALFQHTLIQHLAPRTICFSKQRISST